MIDDEVVGQENDDIDIESEIERSVKQDGVLLSDGKDVDEEKDLQVLAQPSSSSSSSVSLSPQSEEIAISEPNLGSKEIAREVAKYSFFESKRRKPVVLSVAFVAASIVEFACEDDSSIGKVSKENDITVVRLTKSKGDLCTKTGLELALSEITANPGCSLHGSLPCTPWSGWQKYSQAKLGPKFRKKLKQDRELSRLMVVNFAICAKACVTAGGNVSFEWPKGATGWTLKELTDMERELNMSHVLFDGCALGVKSKSGEYIKKPWCISTTSKELVEALSPYVCTADHKHVPCAGSETLGTGFYTRQMAKVILQGLFPDTKVMASLLDAGVP